jgi:glutathione peroxidase-family protein
MTGNFEKFLINKKGERVARITNGVLLEYAYKDGYCESPEVELEKLSKMIEDELAK